MRRPRKHNSAVYYRIESGTMHVLSSSGNWYRIDPDGQCNCPSYRKCWHQDFRLNLVAAAGKSLEKAGWSPGRIVRELRHDFPEIDE
jgi:hypothetical protein